MILGVRASACGMSFIAWAKWALPTCGPAPSSVKASTRTNSCGSSTLRDQSNQRLPGSCRVARVKSPTRSIQRSDHSGLVWNLTTMKYIEEPLAGWAGARVGAMLAAGRLEPEDAADLLPQPLQHCLRLGAGPGEVRRRLAPGLQVALELGLGARGPDDDLDPLPGEQHAVRRGQLGGALGQVDDRHGLAAEGAGWLRAQPGHGRADHREVGDPHRELAGLVYPVDVGDLVQAVRQ